MFYHDVGGCFNALYRVHPILLIKIFLFIIYLLNTVTLSDKYTLNALIVDIKARASLF